MGGPRYRVSAKVFPGESSAFRRQRRRCLRVSLPLGGAVVATFAASGLRVKTLDFGLDNGGVNRRFLAEGIVVELRFFRCRSGIIGDKFSFLFFFVYL